MRLFLILSFILSLFSGFVFASPINISNQIEASVTTSSAKFLDYSLTRKYLILQNKGSTDVFLKFKAVHSASEGIKIIAGGNYEPVFVPIEAVYLKSASGTNTVTIIEGN